MAWRCPRCAVGGHEPLPRPPLLQYQKAREGGDIDPWAITIPRVVATLTGCVLSLVVSRVIFPYRTGKELRKGMCALMQQLWIRWNLITRAFRDDTLLDFNVMLYMETLSSKDLQVSLPQ